jgi:hypothetical protein
MRWSFHDTGETMAAVHKRAARMAKPGHFNILGFFGCCFRCNHSPECTSKCMNKHNIQNGFDDHKHESATDKAAMTHDRLAQASEAISFVQLAEGRDHKPIKLHLDDGAGKTIIAPERPVNTGSNTDSSKSADTLSGEQNDTNGFSLNSFFKCAYGCKHKVHCEKSCMERHGIPDQPQKR